MTAVARGLYQARRHAGQFFGVGVALSLALLVSLGGFAEALWSGELLVLWGMALYAFTLGRAVFREAGLYTPSKPATKSSATWRELELGLLLVVGVYALLAATGGPRSFLYPLVYALVSFLLIIHRNRWVAGAWIAAACALEFLLVSVHDASWTVAAYHVTFILFFAAGNVLVLASLVRRLRGRQGRAVEAELARIRREATDFRLIASQLPLASRAVRSREDEELRMAHGAVHAIHEQLFFSIDLLCVSLRLHTAALLWVEADEATDARDSRKTPTLTIKEMATASEMAREDPRLDGPGILAAVLRNPKPMRLKSLGGRRIPPYYQGPERVTDLAVIPLMEGAKLRGLLCADRLGDEPFDEEEEAVLIKAAEQALRVVQHERSFAAVEREKYEQEQFYRASELLNQALTLNDVYAKTFAALGAIAPYDVAVLTRYDQHAGRHEVLAVRVDEVAAEQRDWNKATEGLAKLSFGDGTGLVSMAVKNRHHMPATGDYPDTNIPIFDDARRFVKAKSALIFPLIRGEQVLGAVTLISARPRAYPTQVREMLRVISHQVGVSLQNARMYQSMEERATKDGLTGLTNHRAFQERLEQLHALAERTEQRFSIILTDIDHFKSVNDTYGHPVGDAVLKRVASVFQSRARKVDIVARYGGEEFVIVLPDTDAEGAAKFADRLREEVAGQTMTSDHGNFCVTLSMGVAEYPGDSEDRQQLIEMADQALYYCKEHGRNRVTAVRDLP